MSALTAGPDRCDRHVPSWADSARDVVREIAGGHLDDPLRHVADHALAAAAADSVDVLAPGPTAAPTGHRMTVALTDSDGVRAVLSIARDTDRSPFTELDHTLASLFAGQAALALELADGPARRDRSVRIDERDRMARELSVHVIGRLFALGLVLQGAANGADPASRRKFEHGAEEIDETIKQIRATIYRLATTPPG